MFKYYCPFQTKNIDGSLVRKYSDGSEVRSSRERVRADKCVEDKYKSTKRCNLEGEQC